MPDKEDKGSDQKQSASLSDFTILSISLPTLPSYPVPATHYMYLRLDAPPVPTTDTTRSIFVTNVPVDAQTASMRALFKQIGGARVERVEFEGDAEREQERRGLQVKGLTWTGTKRKRDEGISRVEAEPLPEVWESRTRKSGSSAVVVFVDRATAEAVMKQCRRMAKKGESLEWKQTEPWGSSRYLRHHELSHPPRAELQANVNAYLSAYADMEAKREAELKKLRSEPDEDGFVTVTRGGRQAPAKLESAKEAQERQKERAKKRVGGLFYRFQGREERKKREGEVRRRYEEDVKKIEEVRRKKGGMLPET